ncbi:MAG: UDP-N-acetylmuramoyl-L-alanyl-D-glutamate--2,6-diaminopimelate ligase [Aminivibrio sp.]|jgi:UDP-N-acetylmuramoyl-L-alanyl-D-glutamate--2,6-diaminopimelate ligase
MPMLSSVLNDFEEKYGYPLKLKSGDGDIPVEHVTGDSRDTFKNSVFCCIKGENSDGLDYASAAAANGAVAFLSDRKPAENLPWIMTGNVRRDMGRLSALVYGEPCEKLKMFAVTGTNGKSTTAWMIRHILRSCGIKTGIFGTIVYDDGSGEREAERTTPESCEIQRLLAEMVKNGCLACVMEASSHGLDLGRLEGCAFDGAVFTNLSEEHLDYHGAIENYFLAKERLFTAFMKPGWRTACNADDPWAKRLIERFSPAAVPFGLEPAGEGYFASVTSSDASGSGFGVSTPEGGNIRVFLPLPGRFNVYNALGAIALLFPFIEDRSAISAALKTMPQVPGRLERYFFSNGACAVIDFAHTPAALKNVLSELRLMCGGVLTAVFGHGGERFRQNRPLLGLYGAQICDKLIITMDNPRGEDPADIAGQIMEGVAGSGKETGARIILDRREAVRAALDEAGDGDIVAVTGKGPEKFISIKGRFIPYSDRDTVLEWARERGLTWR